jgi:dTMP kinase
MSPDAPSRRTQHGFLAVFEGIGGSGKSTVAKRLAEALERDRWDVTTTREPGGTELGASLRAMLLSSEARTDEWAEAFLFEADRAQTYAEVLKPTLNRGGVVISDRGPFGTVAYQGFGRGLDTSLIEAMSRAAWRDLSADVVFVVDIDPRVSLNRRLLASEQDRFDEEAMAFQDRVRQGYLYAADRASNAVVLDGLRTPDEVYDEVFSLVLGRLTMDESI